MKYLFSNIIFVRKAYNSQPVTNKQKTKSVGWVRERTIQTEGPPLVGGLSANILRIEGATWSAWRIPTIDYHLLKHFFTTSVEWQRPENSISFSTIKFPPWEKKQYCAPKMVDNSHCSIFVLWRKKQFCSRKKHQIFLQFYLPSVARNNATAASVV
jgi:hypothetical protein